MNVGILGGGQLAVMLAEALFRLGATPRAYDPDPDAPAHRRVPGSVRGAFDDVQALRDFCARCDVVTYELEGLPVDALRAATTGVPVVPDIDVLEVAQDRAREKAFLARHGLHPVRHAVVAREHLASAAASFGFPSIAKTTRGGYDGKGQFVLRGVDDARAAEEALPGADWVLEERIPLVGEASCIIARARGGVGGAKEGAEEVAFPVVENVHRDHVLDRSLVPCRLPDHVLSAVRELSMAAARALDARGLLAVELFIASAGDSGGLLVGDHRVFINELAPRPHNSGHLLSRACTFGQFDALARILTGVPLGTPQSLAGSTCMGNLLGDVWLAQQSESAALDLDAWGDFPEVVDVHLYGKLRPAPRRKMGHFVVCRSTPEAAFSRAEAFRLALSRPRPTTPRGAS